MCFYALHESLQLSKIYETIADVVVIGPIGTYSVLPYEFVA